MDDRERCGEVPGTFKRSSKGRYKPFEGADEDEPLRAVMEPTLHKSLDLE